VELLSQAEYHGVFDVDSDDSYIIGVYLPSVLCKMILISYQSHELPTIPCTLGFISKDKIESIIFHQMDMFYDSVYLSGNFSTIRRYFGRYLLWAAIKKIDIQMIVKLVEDEGISVDISDELGYTPVHRAVKYGYMIIVDLFIQYGADVNISCNMTDLSPLHTATKNGRTDIIDSLVRKGGANINAFDSLKRTPLHLAIRKKRNNALVLLLIYENIIVNIQDEWGQTPLHWAISQEKISKIDLLLKADANVNIMDKNFQTPVHLALRSNVHQIWGLILGTTRPDLGILDVNFKSPMDHAYEILERSEQTKKNALELELCKFLLRQSIRIDDLLKHALSL
jgi:ankyrin repeat protein